MFTTALDFHARVRLINYIRKEVWAPLSLLSEWFHDGIQKPPAPSLKMLSGKETIFSSDDYLLPVIEDDPLLCESRATEAHDPVNLCQ